MRVRVCVGLGLSRSVVATTPAEVGKVGHPVHPGRDPHERVRYEVSEGEEERRVGELVVVSTGEARRWPCCDARRRVDDEMSRKACEVLKVRLYAFTP